MNIHTRSTKCQYSPATSTSDESYTFGFSHKIMLITIAATSSTCTP